ncbi:hypothetical protein TRICI_004469 [Trichomonascus ciferrii]|uniref:Uncharacterized protein n=1 Tax=Trichomonascus ciferrii TaxID=44093 RepID=A0A642V760_9ASCO|nr:hypothetical protein TRICI_004469 [Trichomonascus ciferrii]
MWRSMSSGGLIFDRKGIDEGFYYADSERPVVSDLEFPEEHVDGLPYRAEVVAHVRLMEAFYNLRREVEEKDGVFGLCDGLEFPDPAPDVYGRVPTKEETVREARWGLYVQRAVERYERWWENVVLRLGDEDGQRALLVQDVEQGSEYFRTWAQRTDYKHTMQEEMLPPLDVLMVWHAHMLNPHAYAEDCARQGAGHVWAAGMPWDLVHHALGADHQYYPSPGAVAFFEANVGRKWDNVDDPLTKKLECVRCGCLIKVPWFNIQLSDSSGGGLRARHDEMSYGHWGMRVRCGNCRVLYTHDVLRVLKFQRDLEHFFERGLALPGCVLRDEDATLAPPLWDRVAVYRVMGSQRLRAQVRTFVMSREELHINDVKYLLTRHRQRHRLEPRETRYVDKITRRYWDNNSIFSVELTGAVARLSEFIVQIHRRGWAHQHLSGFSRMLSRYKGFIGLHDAATNLEDELYVPTEDVDLVWHTHQLKPQQYYWYSVEHTAHGRFIEHRDKVEETMLSEAFIRTSQKYEHKYQRPYSLCPCWYCMATREAAHLPTAPLPDRNCGHISAHCAIMSASTCSLKKKQQYAAKLQSLYDTALHKQRKQTKNIAPQTHPKDIPITEYPYSSFQLNRQFWGTYN